MPLVFLNTLCHSEYHSQWGQDQIVNDRFFHNKKDGIFIDIGAHNGIMFSNSLFYEKELNWNGICIEPIPIRFEELKMNRNCICIQGCISDRTGKNQFLYVDCKKTSVEMLSGLVDKYDPKHVDRINKAITAFNGKTEMIDVDCFLFNDLLEKNNISHVDFLSIDTEGGEFDIISTIDFSRYAVDVIVLEDNYHDPRFVPYLAEKGFDLEERIKHDMIFVNRVFKDKVKNLQKSLD